MTCGVGIGIKPYVRNYVSKVFQRMTYSSTVCRSSPQLERGRDVHGLSRARPTTLSLSQPLQACTSVHLFERACPRHRSFSPFPRTEIPAQLWLMLAGDEWGHGDWVVHGIRVWKKTDVTHATPIFALLEDVEKNGWRRPTHTDCMNRSGRKGDG